MTNTFYIGTRADWNEMNNAVNHSVSRLNEKMSKTLRDIALQKGIKKTEQGAKLLFYSVSQDELDTLMANSSVRPLLKVNQDQMSNSLNKVNSSYPRRMDMAMYGKYQAELNKAMFDCVEVIGTDKNERSQREKITSPNPYKVGDWIEVQRGHGGVHTNAINKMRKEHYGYSCVNLSDSARVYRVSGSSYWIEFPVFKAAPEGVSNWKWAEERFDNLIIAKGCNSEYQHDWDWTVPYEGNEDAFTFIQAKSPIRFTKWELKYPGHTKYKGYRSEYTQRD